MLLHGHRGDERKARVRERERRPGPHDFIEDRPFASDSEIAMLIRIAATTSATSVAANAASHTEGHAAP